jgi:hypothetical protein
MTWLLMKRHLIKVIYKISFIEISFDEMSFEKVSFDKMSLI